MTKVDCSSHGESEATFVCVHLVESISLKAAVGFNWLQDEEGNFQAFCDACWNSEDEEWAAISDEVCRILCLGCLKDAAKINGVKFDP
ncbi:hypothetical protein [Henriciella litoralis]|uniref:hypothetical protein n=1 Tax=Henriciella litoralis TaxID=568102 RepID=UPI000A041637|nr:hypothetical protein [Henriciella litoralis]